MLVPGMPSNEAQRLTALRSLNILDTPSEERFDRLTRMAKRLFDVPIAIISLVDEQRQWFKSCIGLTVSETPRDISFCGHAILGEQIFIIPDATKDPRFCDNPIVSGEPNIRFYAGCPLRLGDGVHLGTLCIIDTKPRDFSDDDKLTLKDLAITVERELLGVQLATKDELTQLLNRRGFNDLAHHSLTLCRRHKVDATLVFIDLDNFKQINDEFGHHEGDQVLQIFARLLREVCRESDLIARLGGDEFIMLFINASPSSCEEVISRLHQLIAEHLKAMDLDYHFSFSAGSVRFNPDDYEGIEALINDADKCMYENKKQRKIELDVLNQL